MKVSLFGIILLGEKILLMYIDDQCVFCHGSWDKSIFCIMIYLVLATVYILINTLYDICPFLFLISYLYIFVCWVSVLKLRTSLKNKQSVIRMRKVKFSMKNFIFFHFFCFLFFHDSQFQCVSTIYNNGTTTNWSKTIPF